MPNRCYCATHYKLHIYQHFRNKPESNDRLIKDISNLVDKIFANVRKNATEGGWDPIRLPSDSAEFDVTVEYILI